jgi:membrane protein YdbS with pleckstrin-like domain
MNLIVLIAMLFCHIIDDYKLQGWLAQAKQKKWWEENAPEKLYNKDYVIALIEHAFSWTCSIHISILSYCLITHCEISMLAWIPVFVLNVVIHAWIDHLKANMHKINLIQDQVCHIGQICITWAIYSFVC